MDIKKYKVKSGGDIEWCKAEDVEAYLAERESELLNLEKKLIKMCNRLDLLEGNKKGNISWVS